MGMVGGRTRGEISRGAFETLLHRFGCWEAVRDGRVADIEDAIAAVTFADAKAWRLKESLRAITHSEGRLTLESLQDMSVDRALVWLERLPGVGRKVSAATVNFSTLRKRALVIDTHHLRVLRRLGVVDATATITRAYDRVMPVLPEDWTAADLDDHHQLLKRLGQTECRHRAPSCRRCSLRDLCPTNSGSTAGVARIVRAGSADRIWF